MFWPAHINPYGGYAQMDISGKQQSQTGGSVPAALTMRENESSLGKQTSIPDILSYVMNGIMRKMGS